MNESTFCFGDFRLIPARRQLWRGSQPVPIQPKVLETLIYLIQHRDRVVGGDELISAVWGRVDVTDNVLGQVVSRARRAVGDNGKAQHSILTVYGIGYHWVRAIEIEPTDIDRAIACPAAEPTVNPRSIPLARVQSFLLETAVAAIVA